MPAYFIVQATINDEPKFQKYREAVVPFIAGFGGKLVAVRGKVEVLEGEHDTRPVVMFEFQSMEAIGTELSRHHAYGAESYLFLLSLNNIMAEHGDQRYSLTSRTFGAVQRRARSAAPASDPGRGQGPVHPCKSSGEYRSFRSPNVVCIEKARRLWVPSTLIARDSDARAAPANRIAQTGRWSPHSACRPSCALR